MAGFLAQQQMRIAARAAVRNLRMLERIADSYGDVYGGNQPPDLDQLKASLERNDIESVANALPGLMAQVLGSAQEQQ
jgi:hypothetical protein